MWVHQKQVRLTRPDIGTCVRTALAQVPGVTITEEQQSPPIYLLRTPINNSEQSSRATSLVVKSDGTAILQYAEWGWWESQRDKERVGPVIEAIGTSLERSCNDG